MSNLQQHGVLGETTNYPTHYDASILYAIPRALGRDKIHQKNNITTNVESACHNSIPISESYLSLGIDWWHCFEVSWLNPQGISQVFMARLHIPANSASIVESKSLKLYLNSFNLTQFTSVSDVKAVIEKDLSLLLETSILVELFDCQDVTNMQISQAKGHCIDSALENTATNTVKTIAITKDVCADMLRFEDKIVDYNHNITIKQTYHSHLLRSNCPVTNQPDWGTIEIYIDAFKINEASLLEYLLTYRQHNGFHEQCVEQVFADLTEKFTPKELMVRAWYTRRGGIDINPCRVSHELLIPKASRLIRQ